MRIDRYIQPEFWKTAPGCMIGLLLPVCLLSGCTNDQNSHALPAPTTGSLFAEWPTPLPSQSPEIPQVTELPPAINPDITSTAILPPLLLDTPTSRENDIDNPDARSSAVASDPAREQFAIFLPLIVHTDTVPEIVSTPAPAAPLPPTSTPPAPAALLPPTSTPPALTAPLPPTSPPAAPDEQIASIPIYDDHLHPDWNAEQSQGVAYDLASETYVYSGRVAIAVAPQRRYGQFFLTVREDAQTVYNRNEILGVSFWLSGGANAVDPGDLAITVVGSNAYPYWVAGDTSVQQAAGIPDSAITDEFPLFSETRLYFLDINRTIPPDTWVEVVLWLDEREFDPDYRYITGIYIKNDDPAFLPTFYVDRMSLLLIRST